MKVTIDGNKEECTAKQFEALMKVSSYLQQFEIDVTISNINVAEDIVIVDNADLKIDNQDS
jgi:hypothetical protein